MERQEVFNVISGEREYQEDMKPVEKSHIVEDFNLGDAISAIQYNIDLARSTWYNETNPYPNSMHFIRKIAAIAVAMGEQYDMPEREREKQSV